MYGNEHKIINESTRPIWFITRTHVQLLQFSKEKESRRTIVTRETTRSFYPPVLVVALARSLATLASFVKIEEKKDDTNQHMHSLENRLI